MLKDTPQSELDGLVPMSPSAQSSLSLPCTPRPPALHRLGLPAGSGGATASTRVRPEDLTQHMPRLRNVIRRILNNNEVDTEDVLQEVLLTAIKHLHQFRGDASLGTWLHRIAVNAALAFRRQRSLQARHEEGQVETRLLQSATQTNAPVQKRIKRPEQELLHHELRGLINRAIAMLPPMYRDVYLLADLEDQPNEWIAQQLQLKLAAVKSRLHRARKMMRDQLAHYYSEYMLRQDNRASPSTPVNSPANDIAPAATDTQELT